MSNFDIGIAMFAGAVGLIMLRMPVGVAMLLAGGIGYAALVGWSPLLNSLKTLTFSRFSSYTLTVIPFFLLMGELATKGGMSAALFGPRGRGWGTGAAGSRSPPSRAAQRSGPSAAPHSPPRRP